MFPRFELSVRIPGNVRIPQLYGAADAEFRGAFERKINAQIFELGVKAGHLTARGRTVSRRRHICVVAVEITDETDTLLFSSTFSMYCISAES